MENDINYIKEWLGTGSINVFGLPFSGKDTVGVRLAEDLGGKFLSSGMILRAAAQEDAALAIEMNSGLLASTDKFQSIVLEYLKRSDLSEFPLVLSSVGRWEGEEFGVIDAAKAGGHEIKAVVLLNISENEVKKRWEAARQNDDRGGRGDDREERVIDTRLAEFKEKTMPVIDTYHKRNLLITVNGMGERDAVYASVIKGLVEKIHEYREIGDSQRGALSIHENTPTIDIAEGEELDLSDHGDMSD